MQVNTSFQKSRHSFSFDNGVVYRNNVGFLWRPHSFANFASDLLRRQNGVFDSVPASNNKANKPAETQKPDPLTPPASPAPVVPPDNEEKQTDKTPVKKYKAARNLTVNIVLVEAKGHPDAPEDGSSHDIYCKFRLGSQTFKSKSVPNTRQPQWRESFKLNMSNDQLLTISLWDKGKQKNFMGRCVLDLSCRERERTHDIWQQLDGGYGAVHFSLTMCTTHNSEGNASSEPNVNNLASKYAFYNLTPDINVVGELHVKVIGARGLHGRPSAYCTLEVDNEKIRTPAVSGGSEPVWNASYVFNVFDVTSTLDLKVSDNSLNSYFNDFLGRVTIPLLRIKNGESRWYALKDNTRRKSAKGNCPRIRLEMNIYWNPVVASLKLFRPKEVKYIAKPPKFDIALVYKNVKFIRDTFEFLYTLNEKFKRLFEWDDKEYTISVLVAWISFWLYFQPWMTPLLIAMLFPIVYYYEKRQRVEVFYRTQNIYDMVDQGPTEDLKVGETMTEKIKGLPEMTLTITSGIEYLVSTAERLYNLAAFKVPFLSWFTLVLLVVLSAVFYFIPIKYIMIGFAFYKYGRKYMHPDRVPNNDILDFISRIPDNRLLREWKELTVPEPNVEAQCSNDPGSLLPVK